MYLKIRLLRTLILEKGLAPRLKNDQIASLKLNILSLERRGIMGALPMPMLKIGLNQMSRLFSGIGYGWWTLDEITIGAREGEFIRNNHRELCPSEEATEILVSGGPRIKSILKSCD
jgi:hypothetical protein